MSEAHLLDAIRVRALRLRYGIDYGRLVREQVRFAARETANRWLVGEYHLRAGGQAVLLRHHPSPHGTPSNDTWVLREIFRDGAYALPPGVRLPSEPHIVDLGANLGMFVAFMFARFPRARITAFEPDPDSAHLLRQAALINGYGECLTIHEACAMPSDGRVPFAVGGHQFSRIEPEALTQVEALDVFPFLEGADLLKMDIEGGEWRLLQDVRFGAARNVVLEYHPMMCPDPDPRRLVRELLEARGYRIVADDEPMIWAVRSS